MLRVVCEANCHARGRPENGDFGLDSETQVGLWNAYMLIEFC